MSIQSITLLLFLNALIKIHFFKFKLNITVYKEQCSLATSVILIRWLVWVIVHDLIAHRWLLRDIFNFHALVQKKCAWNNLNILKDRKKGLHPWKPSIRYIFRRPYLRMSFLYWIFIHVGLSLKELNQMFPTRLHDVAAVVLMEFFSEKIEVNFLLGSFSFEQQVFLQ